VAGPIMGGWISDNFSWPWIFYINVPLGLAAAWATWTIYRDRETPVRRNPIDTVGLVLLVVWVGCLQLMLDRGKDLDWFNSPTIITLACVALVGFVFFVIWELTDEHPAVDLSLFARRNFTVGAIAQGLGYAAYFSGVVVLPLWLQTQMGYTALRAGLVLAPIGLVAFVFTPLVGRLLDRWGPRPLLTFSFIVFTLVLGLRAGYTTEVDFAALWMPSVVMGIGVAAFGVPMITLTLSGMDPARITAAAGLGNFVRLSLGAIGTSTTITLWDHRTSLHHAHLAEAASPPNPAFNEITTQLQEFGLSYQQALGAVEHMVFHQADMLGVNDIFLIFAMVNLTLAALVWLGKPARSGTMAGGGAH
jgi:MFS transporter, DHA2 family, multidrug resistance protein